MLLFRSAEPSMLPALRRLDVEAWGEDMAASEDMLAARMEVNPTGNFVAIDARTGVIVGSVWTLWVDDRPFTTWAEATGGGLYRGVHNPFGDVLFGANISAAKWYTDQVIGTFLLDHVAGLVVAMGKRYARMGGRMPGYASWSHMFTPHDYIRLYRGADRVYFLEVDPGRFREGPKFTDLFGEKVRRRGSTERIDPMSWPIADPPALQTTLFDASLQTFTSPTIRAQAVRIVRVLPGYFPDPESCDNGVLIEWENPDRSEE